MSSGDGPHNPRTPNVPVARLVVPPPPVAGAVPAPPQVFVPAAPPVEPAEDELQEKASSYWPWGIVLALALLTAGTGVWWVWFGGKEMWHAKSASEEATGDAGPDEAASAPAEEEQPPTVIVLQEGDGSLNFLAETAAIHGPSARLEVRAGHGVIADWLTADDWLSWDFQVQRPGFFRVEVVYAADAAMAGSEYTLAVDDQEQTRTVKETGGLETFGQDTFYLVIPHSGRQTLIIRRGQVAEAGVMVLESIRFSPVQRTGE